LEQARQSYRQALEINPKDGQVWLALGIVTALAGDPAGAIQAYSQGLKITPSDVGYLLLARALNQAGQSSQAEAAAAEAQRLSRNFAAAERSVNAIFAPAGGVGNPNPPADDH